MPWRGPVKGSDQLADQFPSLGWAIADWLDDLFWWMRCTDEQVRKLVEFYRLDPKSGERVVRRGQLMGPKGCGKSPEAAKFAIAELCGDVVPDGWSADGEPVGAPWVKPTPLVQIAAVSLDQTDNTYGALQELLAEHDSQAADRLGLDVGDTRTVKRANHRARIDKVTASAGAREGQPLTFGVLDESHLWTPQNGGKKLAATIRRNVGKMNGSSLETTNAYDPALESVAQGTDEAAVARTAGIYQWKPQAPKVASTANRRDVKQALRKVYVDCDWVDLERLIDEMHDPDMTDADGRRFYLNEITQGASAAWSRDKWKALRDPDKEICPKDLVALGFDGARYRDSTALIGCRLHDKHLFELGVWERPPEVEEDDWEVPAGEVAAAVEDAFDTYNVALMYADPPYWEDEVDRWAGQHGPVKKWYTTRVKPMAFAVRTFHSLIASQGLSHSGLRDLTDPLSRHVLAAQKRSTLVRDDEGRFMWTIQKESPKSPRKIDAAMAAILATEAAGDAIAAGALKKRTGRAAFV